MSKQQNKITPILLTQQTYRWLVSINIFQNTGQIDDKNIVTLNLNRQQANLLENGYTVANILKEILQKQKLSLPSTLNNLRNDQSKNSKITNWNFIWLTFDQIQVQFDPRIKDLIIQGEIVLVGQILKQLCEHDFHRDLTKMNQIKINQKMGYKSVTNQSKPKATLDLKKINLKKSPAQANSSLQLLILLLTSSLNMSLQQILGLFTNQNKYLAHVIVKGVNEDFNGIILFYSLLNKYEEKINLLHKQDPEDTYACFHAIKPGFLSKDPRVVDLTISLFQKINNLYNWFISQTGGNCATTLILGIKRHPSKAQKYFSIFSKIIENREIDFFKIYFKKGFQNTSEFIQLTSLIIKPLAQSSLLQIVSENQIFNDWLQTAEELYETDVQNKLIVINFVGELMCWTPQVIQKNQLILHSIGQGWPTYSMFQFTTLFNQLLIVLQKLAQFKNSMARKIFNIIIDIFTAIHQISDKKQYIVSTFLPFLAQFPTIPSQLLIQNYRQTFLTSSDFLMICQAVDIAQEFQTLSKIGEIIREMFLNDAVINYYMGTLLCQICKKVYKKNQEEAFEFVLQLIKNCLSAYAGNVLKKKGKANNLQPTYNQNQKPQKKESDQKSIKEKAGANIISLVQKLISIISKEDSNKSQNLQIVKYELMDTNSHIKNQNFKTGSKEISTILYKKFQLTRQQENSYDQSFKKRANINREQAALQKKAKSNSVMVLSRLQGPEHLKKQFQQIVEKRKKEQEMRQQEEIKRKKEEEMKKILYKKQLQKMNLIKGGFGDGEAQLKEQGFWNKFIKQTNQPQIIPHELIEDIHLQAAQLILNKYHKLLRYLFLNYSSTMHTTRSVNNFQDQLARKQILSSVQIIKMLKDYNFMFLTNSTQVQGIVRDINVKILKRKQIINELDFHGFEQFIRQFSLICFTKKHSVTTNKKDKIFNDFSFLTLPQLITQLFSSLKNSFKVKGEPLSFFQQAEFVENSQNQQVKQLNQQLQNDPNIILPEGFKKIIDKKINFYQYLGTQVKFRESYHNTIQIVDELIKQTFGFSIIQPISFKQTKVTAKPLLQLNVKEQNPNKIKSRALSTMIDRKIATQSLIKIISKNEFSKGIKQGIAKLPLSQKLIGQNVGFVLQQVIRKIQAQNQPPKTVPKNKSFRDIIVKTKNPVPLTHRRAQSVAINEPISTDLGLKNLKNNLLSKNKLRPSLEEQQKKIKQTQEKVKKKKQMQQKLMLQHKARLQQRRKRQEEERNKKLQQAKQRKQQIHKNKQKFEEFNKRQVETLKKQFEQVAIQKKKQQEIQQAIKQTKQQRYRRLRAKIQNDDKLITEIRKQTNQKIMDLYHKPEIQSVFKQYEPSIKATYDFLIRNTYLSLTQRKHKNEIIFETWNYFNAVFEISPLIVDPKDTVTIFKALTKDKQISKQYLVGLNYQQFLQALLRQCIKHKTIFNKIALRIRQQNDDMPPSNEFQQQQEIDVKKLLKEQDIRDDIYDHYGDVQKVNESTLKGLMYYLKVPFTKKGQQKRFRQILARQSKQSNITNIQKLKEKLLAEYTLQKSGNNQPIMQKSIQKQKSKIKEKPNKQIKVNSQNNKEKQTKQIKQGKQMKQSKQSKQVKQAKQLTKSTKQIKSPKDIKLTNEPKGKQKQKVPQPQVVSTNKSKKK